ncbi:MAG: hypothetical protein IH586_04390, partial [Anaerolineaceae bacterium]|nr:hypothetical protein [Anaerolineaceae bacterium]
TLLGAPVGFVVGALVGLLLWVVGLGKGVLVFPMILFAAAAALVGGRRVPFQQRRTWQKIRPFVGALAGLALGLAGMLIGWGLRAAVETLLGG